MINNKFVAIFDLDETLTYRNLPVVITELWMGDSKIKSKIYLFLNFITKCMLVPSLMRRFEYAITGLISVEFIERSMDLIFEREVNKNMIRRLIKYKILGARVIIITAGPGKIALSFANHLDVEYISSSVIFGIVLKDLLGKKEIIYKKINEEGGSIQVIYSDNILDFSEMAKINMLVKSGKIARYKK